MRRVQRSAAATLGAAAVAVALAVASGGCSSGGGSAPSYDRGTHTPSGLLSVERLTDAYHAEGACVADFDNDGALDVASGPYVWHGPTFVTATAFRAPIVFSTGGYADAFFAFADDVDGDGWIDVVEVGLPNSAAHWYRNDQGAGGPWERHLLWPAVGSEAPTMVDLDADGQQELVLFTGMQIAWLERDVANPTSPWQLHTIASLQAVGPAVHGLGTGDVDGDGRLDVLVSTGWLEQPASLDGDPPWTLHPHLFAAAGGAQMHADDVDGDGDADVITSLDAHGFGLSWFEQVPDGVGTTFVEHVILPVDPLPGTHDQFSQLHALALADVDGDGLRDLVTGKTWLAHNGRDIGSAEPPVLFVLLLDRSAGARYVPRCIDDASGIGRQIATQDLDGDGKIDVVTANKNGLFVFRNP